MQISIAASRVLFKAVHIGRHARWIVNRVGLQWYGIGEMCPWKAVVAVIQVHAIVIICVLDNFKGEADPFILARDHVVRALQVVKELLS